MPGGFGLWQFTEEQRQLLQKGDREACAKFYFDNYSIIRGMAIKYCNRKKDYGKYGYDWEDCVQQVFLDLPEYRCFDELGRGLLSVKLRQSFFYSFWGGFPQHFVRGMCPALLTLDSSPFEEGEITFLDLDFSRDDIGEFWKEYQEQEFQKFLISLLKQYLTPRRFEFLEYRLFTGFTLEEIARALGVKSRAVVKNMLRESLRVLRAHASDILIAFQKFGFFVDFYLPLVSAVEEIAKKEIFEKKKKAAIKYKECCETSREELLCKHRDNYHKRVQDPEYRQKLAEQSRQRRLRLLQDPEALAKFREHRRQYKAKRRAEQRLLQGATI